MGAMVTATLEVEFELEDGQPEGLPKIILDREVAQFRQSIEMGRTGKKGVKRGSATVKILSQQVQTE